MSNNNQSSGGIGFLSLLTILFIGLKLGGVIDWQWFWVLSPIIIPLVLVGGVILPILALIYNSDKMDDRMSVRTAAAIIFAIPTWLITYVLYSFIG